MAENQGIYIHVLVYVYIYICRQLNRRPCKNALCLTQHAMLADAHVAVTQVHTEGTQ